jgi:ABC-type molybdate transport system substrate-binding protein
MTTAAFLEDIMRPSFRTMVVSTLTLMISSTLATAAEVRVLSVGSTQIAAKAIATEFEKGHPDLMRSGRSQTGLLTSG